MKAAFRTVTLCDKYKGSLQVALPMLQSYGKRIAFCGEIETIKCYEDNAVIKETLSQPGRGKVLVVEGGASLRCALLGDMLAGTAVRRGWSGIVVNGCVRDITALARLNIGIRALGHVPSPSDKHGLGVVGAPVTFAGVTFTPGHYLYADADGVIVAEKPIS